MRAKFTGLALTVAGLVAVAVVGTSPSGVSAASRPTSSKIAAVSVAEPTQVSRNEPSTAEAAAGARALTRITYPWRTMLPGWRIVFLPSRKGYLALTYRTERRIEVYVRSDRSDEAIAHDIAHELGHAVDVTYNTDGSRALFLRMRGLPEDMPWWACNSCGDLQTPAGDFAETFALYAAPRYKFYSELGRVPDAGQVAAIAERVLGPVGALAA